MANRRRRGRAQQEPLHPHNIQQVQGDTPTPVPPAICLDDRPAADSEDAAAPPARARRGDDPGAALRRAREAQGRSLDDLSRVTKISVTKLRAIEENDVDLLPSDVYVRGFLRAYAREVDLDPEQTVQDYYAHLQTQQEMFAVTMPAAFAAGADGGNGEHAGHGVVHDDGMRPADLLRRPARRAQWLVLALAALGLVGYLSWTGGDTVSSADLTMAETSPVASTPAPVPVPSADVTPAANVTPDVLQFQLRPQGPCWVSASADGETVVSRLLQQGEQQTFEVRDELVMRVGDPSAITYSINGQPGRQLGAPGEPVNVRITKDNFREFVSS